MATTYRVLHRVTLGDRPTRDDFLSRAARGIAPPNDTPELVRINDGISTFATVQQARNKALAYPHMGRYIARLEIPDDAPVRIERTTSSRGHYTVWGEPDDLLRYVVSVVPV